MKAKIPALWMLTIALAGFAQADCPGQYESCGAGCLRSYDATLGCVRQAVAAADYGHTVEVLGNAEWADTLSITKGIHLKGASSRIIMDIGQGASAINIEPDERSIREEHILEISNFVFDGAGSETVAIMLNGPRTNTFPVAKIHNNAFQNFKDRVLIVADVWKGVVYENTWRNNTRHSFRYMGGNAETWNNLRHYVYGTDEVVFFEDNEFVDLTAVASSGGQATRVVLRYNDYSQQASLWPLVDVHGNQGSGVCGTMGWEMYGNRIIGNGYAARYDLRGGRGMFFQNTMTDGILSPRVRNENCNDLEGTCKRNSDTQTFEIQDSYHFLNRDDGEVKHTSYSSSGCDEEMQENSEYWNENTAFVPGTDTELHTGIGIGTREQMDIVTECNDGVGFWVTDEGEWNTLNPEPDGQLYRCTGNSWELFYVPYAYPHPLRQGAFCGNGICDNGETCSSCPEDCGPCPAECGNGICDNGETCSSCPEDCGACVCVHPADREPCDGCIDSIELLAYIRLWKTDGRLMAELMEAIRIWKQGC